MSYASAREGHETRPPKDWVEPKIVAHMRRVEVEQHVNDLFRRPTHVWECGRCHDEQETKDKPLPAMDGAFYCERCRKIVHAVLEDAKIAADLERSMRGMEIASLKASAPAEYDDEDEDEEDAGQSVDASDSQGSSSGASPKLKPVEPTNDDVSISPRLVESTRVYRVGSPDGIPLQLITESPKPDVEVPMKPAKPGMRECGYCPIGRGPHRGTCPQGAWFKKAHGMAKEVAKPKERAADVVSPKKAADKAVETKDPTGGLLVKAADNQQRLAGLSEERATEFVKKLEPDMDSGVITGGIVGLPSAPQEAPRTDIQVPRLVRVMVPWALEKKLFALLDTGLYGRSVQDVAERMLCRGVEVVSRP